MNIKIKSALLGIALAIVVVLVANSQQSQSISEEKSEVKQVYVPTAYEDAEPTENIEVATEESIYYDVPIDKELQDYIIQKCEEYNISPALVIAMIGQESQYEVFAVGDGGNSVGLMQIQERWHEDRMERLGCTNLQDPYQNITVGVDLLAELYEMNPDTYWVLMAYNGGIDYADNMMAANTYSTYAVEVSERTAELERSMENEQK